MAVTLARGQDKACSNIAIINDLIIEEDEEFNVTVVTVSNTLAAGVNILRSTTIVGILNDDGKSIQNHDGLKLKCHITM